MDSEEEFEIYPLEIGAYYKVAPRCFRGNGFLARSCILAGPDGGIITPDTVLLCARRIQHPDRVIYPSYTMGQPYMVYRKWVQLDYFHTVTSNEQRLHHLDLAIRGPCPQPWGYDLVKVTSPLAVLALCAEGLVP